MFFVIARFRPQNRALRSNPQKISIPTSQRSHFVRLCYSAGRFVTSGQIRTPEIDTHFSSAAIPQATAGFMRLATSPDGNTVYAAWFSGHILKFSAQTAKYLGEVAVRPAKGLNQLSGLAVLDHGKDALVTVENRHEAALVSVRDGKVSHLFKGVTSNRWIVAAGY
ncbi:MULTISPECIES: hypothetical protein [unclassified Acidiphilium]|uniref:hypothetical protein n=1 Tax=unclassified Acidiphilium TaxID=2617493 RepID=UPI000BDB2C49|nr:MULTISPECIES: hypothetical protein [unclassified Acidiphilium]OYV54172.1 MAG: hypothetical protein B7Z76_15440 [Acidiphilium sp. 20-67-58]HQT65506.1 hypothetical protein [Acidocella sp.]